MEKNWLIRTKSCHILGPVSREKVIELLKNGSIKPEDEVCSGNGYWIWLRETDLVERFLLGDEKQTFNPISEAPTIYGELPQAASYSDDITLVSNRPNLADLAGKLSDNHTSPSSTMAKVAERTAELMRTPRVPEGSIAVAEKEHDPTHAPPKRVAPPAAAPKPLRREYIPSPTPVTPGKQLPKRRAGDDPRPVTVLRPRGLVSDKVFMIGALLALFALAAIFFYRKRIITQFIQSAVSVVLPSAIAQESPDGKKKIFFPKS